VTYSQSLSEVLSLWKRNSR